MTDDSSSRATIVRSSQFRQKLKKDERIVRGEVIETERPNAAQDILVRPFCPGERLDGYALGVQEF